MLPELLFIYAYMTTMPIKAGIKCLVQQSQTINLFTFYIPKSNQVITSYYY